MHDHRPRGTHFLMGLANQDGSFTGTVYMDVKGNEDSFEALDTAGKVRDFFERHYGDAVPLLGTATKSLEDEFLNNRTGVLGTIRTTNWTTASETAQSDATPVVLIGDAAHAIVPFFGQGCNCALEDCLVLDRLLAEKANDLQGAFASFQDHRKPNGDAIADMALDNFIEMRERVADPKFNLRKQVESIVEKAFPHLFRSRYMMVVGGCVEVPYHVAQKCGVVHDEIMETLCIGLEKAEKVDLEQAKSLLTEKLIPLHNKYNVDLALVGH